MLTDRLLYGDAGVPVDPVRAREEYRLAAERGSTEAMYALGQLLLAGVGGPADPAEAAAWFRHGAEFNDVACQLALADLLLRGVGVPQDEMAALALIRRAVELGSADAQLALGQLYELGRLVPQDSAQAVSLYRQAAEQGQMEATFRLGLAYMDGMGVAPDTEEAARLFLAAGSEGHAGAQYHLGLLYLQGRGVERDPEAAYLWFRIAQSQLPPGSTNALEVERALADAASTMDEAELAAAEARAEELLAAAPEPGQSAPDEFGLSGSLFAGLCWQSNANGGPSASLVQFRGNLVPLSDSGQAESDVNVFAVLGLTHTADLDGTTLETVFSGYANRQREATLDDNTLLELSTGPLIELGQTALGDLTVRPYAIGTYLASEDTAYMWAGAAAASRRRPRSTGGWAPTAASNTANEASATARPIRRTATRTAANTPSISAWTTGCRPAR